MLSRTGVLDGNFARANSIIYRMLAHEPPKFALVYYTLGRFSLRFEQAPYLNVAAQSSTDLPLCLPRIHAQSPGRADSTKMWTAEPRTTRPVHVAYAVFAMQTLSFVTRSCGSTWAWMRGRCVLWRMIFHGGRFKSPFSAARTYPPSLAAHS